MFMLLEKEFSLKATTRTGQRRLLKNDGKMEHMVQLLLKYPLALCSIKVQTFACFKLFQKFGATRYHPLQLTHSCRMLSLHFN